MVTGEAHTVCQCPICKKGEVHSFRNPEESEPYWELLYYKLQCNKCGTEFKKIVLDKSSKMKKCIAYETEA